MAEQNQDLTEFGFRMERDETTASGITYPVEFAQADDLEVYRSYWAEQGHNPDEVLLGIVNAAQKQGATQGPKQSIRDAQNDPEGDVDAAVQTAQETTASYVIGAPRQRTGGITKKVQHEMGEEITRRVVEKGEALTKDELAAIMDEYLK